MPPRTRTFAASAKYHRFYLTRIDSQGPLIAIPMSVADIDAHYFYYTAVAPLAARCKALFLFTISFPLDV